MLDSITLQFTETKSITIPSKGVTIFVGPNNSGKSLVLREIEIIFSANPFPDNLKLIESFKYEWPTVQEIEAAIEKSKVFRSKGIPQNLVVFGKINPGGVWKVHLSINLRCSRSWRQEQNLLGCYLNLIDGD